MKSAANTLLLSSALLSASTVVIPFAHSQAFPKPELSIERLMQYPLIQGRSPSGPAMSPDGSKIVFGWNKTGARRLDLYAAEFLSGNTKVIVDSSTLSDLPRQDDTRSEIEKAEAALYDGGIGGAQFSPDGKELMFSYKGRTWFVSPDGSNLRPMVDGSVGLSALQYTDDMKAILLSNGQNVFRLDRTSGHIKQLTFVSKPNTAVDGAEYSPDGKYLAVQWSDSSKLGNHVMMDFSKDRAVVVPIRRNWNSELSTDVQIGIVATNGGLIKWVPGIPRTIWTKSVAWAPDSSKVSIGWMKDDFKEYTISVVDPATVLSDHIYTEKAPSNFINDWREVIWSKDSKHLIFGTDIKSDKHINRSVFSMTPDGRNVEPIYNELHDVGAFARPKNSDRIVLVTASSSPLTTEIVLVDGKKRQKISVMPGGYSTPKNFNWADLPLFSDDGKRIATLASSRTQNPELYSVAPSVKRLTVSQSDSFKKIKWADIKQVEFKTADGRLIRGLLYTKPGMDPTKKIPAILSNIYADSGKAAWSGYMENYAAMNLDMVVLSVDFRSSWGYDGEFNSGYFKKMGLIDADEAVAAKEYLASLPYVRADRVGLWGWSYGGFLTCMTMLTKPGVFDTGVAVASVTDWKTYNEWYTRRRLGLVKDDPEKIFEKTSPITYASGLEGNLLLVHGMLDDNVLYQDTARLYQKLIENGKYFDSLSYPRDDHSIGKETSRPHVMASILRYLHSKLHR